MKILYISQYYPPEIGAPAARVSELARYWAAAGHEVTVLTGFPNHPDGIVPPEWKPRLRRLVYRETVDGVRVLRTWLFAAANRGALKRMMNYASFAVSAALRSMFIDRPDVIIATSPQLLVGFAGWWASVVLGRPWIFEVRDLWPESLVAVGAGTEDSFLYRALARVASFFYRKSNAIVVVSPPFVDALTSAPWKVGREKLHVVVNGVETELFSPFTPVEDVSHLVPAGRHVVSYVGTVGMAHGIGTVLEAAEMLRHRDDIAFVVAGEGAERQQLESAAKQRGATNVSFLGPVPRKFVPALVRRSAACLVLLKRSEVFRTVIPTKMLEFMAAGRPVIVGVDGQARSIAEAAGAGLFIEPENAAQLAAAIEKMLADPVFAQQAGCNGRSYIERNFSRAATAELYLDVLNRVLGRGSSARAARPAP